jgi:DNA primase
MSTSKFVDFRALKREVTMVQVLEHYGLMNRMRRSGDSITGACPIHGGKNETAFRVSVSKNCWNCFSQCACGGNVLDFVAKMEKVSLPKAANLLVEWFSLKIPAQEAENDSVPNQSRSHKPVPIGQKSKAEVATEAPAQEGQANGENKPLEFVLKNLQHDHPYLTERGLSQETIATFGLGFCTKGLHKDRIAIPIHNVKGQLVAYAGRWPGNSDKPKYQLPKGFAKSLELFNLHRAIAEPAERPLLIVEGYFDCMRLWQYGLRRVVALMGSSLSPRQEELIRDHTNPWSQVLVMLDEDDAGRAGREDIARRLSRWLFVKVHVFATEGMQPDQLSADEVEQLFGGAA